MGMQKANNSWTGRLELLALIAVVLAVLILLVIWPRSCAWETPPPTPLPWTEVPGRFLIPTFTPIPPTMPAPPTPAITPTP